MKSTSNQHTHVLVDGYNVIHSLPDLKHSLIHQSQDIARQNLANKSIILCDVHNYRVTLIFDGKGNDIEIEHPFKKNLNFSCLFSSTGITADTVIEQLVQNKKKSQSIIVVSQDNLLKQTVSSLGATTMNPKEFENWLKRCQEHISSKIKRHNKIDKQQWKPNNPWNTIP